MSILCNLGKDNVVADFLTRLSMRTTSHVREGRNNWPRKFTDVHIEVSIGYILVKTKW